MSIISSLRLSGIGSPIASRAITTGSNGQPGWNQIANAHIVTGAAIDYAKLNLTGLIVNADLASGAAIDYAKLNLTGLIVNADLAGSIALDKLVKGTAATNQIMVSNGTNNSFTSSPTAAGTITGNALVSTTNLSFGGNSAFRQVHATTLVDAGQVALSSGSYGFVFVQDASTLKAAIFIYNAAFTGAPPATFLVAGNSADFGVASTAGKVNCFWNGSNFVVQNFTGATHTILVSTLQQL